MIIIELLAVVILAALDARCQKLSNEIGAKQIPSSGPRITSLRIRSDIVYRFAQTTVSSTVVNDDYVSRETEFDVNLPDAAFISNFTIETENEIYPGIVREKEAARKQYDKAKKRGQSAGHITTKPRDTNKFRVTINIPARTKVSFILTYEELLRRKRGQYEHILYIDPKQLVDQLLVEVFIYESREITALRIPPLRNDIVNSLEILTTNELATVERPSSKTAYIRYNPSVSDQQKASDQGVSGLFIVQYDVQRSLDAGDIFIVNGYFTHFFAPVGLPPLRKRILFVLDVSGSMSFGRKLEQMKQAMIQILQDLNVEDQFNVITFESNSLSWSSSMVLATEQNVELAIEMIKQLIAEGGTNVNDALTDALRILQTSNNLDNSGTTSAPLIVFLTDGDPTVGETNFRKILNNVQEDNQQNIQIFCLSFGQDANFDFLKKISTRNNAFARKIYDASDAALQLTGFYNEISSVLMSNVSFRYLDNKVNLTSVTQSTFPSFFDGSELVVAGRLTEGADFNSLTLSVVGKSQHGVLELSSTSNIIEDYRNRKTPDFKTSMDFETITERIWAYLSIKKLLQERLKTENSLKREDLKLEAINIAVKYNLVTPVTSMVVTKPEEEKKNDTEQENDLNVQHDDNAATATGTRVVGPHTAALTRPVGPQGLAGKGSALKLPPGLADSDPHFIVKVKGLDQAICFDVMAHPGDVLQLIKDKYSGVTVNSKIVANAPAHHANNANSSHSGHNKTSAHEIKTYLGAIAIKRWHLSVSVTPLTITVNRETVDWKNGSTFSHGKTKIVVDKAGSMLAVIFRDRVTLLVMRHLRTKSQVRAGKVHFLGFYIVDGKGLSYRTHGLLGQFLHRNVALKKSKKTRLGKTLGRLRVSGNIHKARKVMATLGRRQNLATNTTVPCWMVQHNGGKLIDGEVNDYLVKKSEL